MNAPATPPKPSESLDLFQIGFSRRAGIDFLDTLEAAPGRPLSRNAQDAARRSVAQLDILASAVEQATSVEALCAFLEAEIAELTSCVEENLARISSAQAGLETTYRGLHQLFSIVAERAGARRIGLELVNATAEHIGGHANDRAALANLLPSGRSAFNVSQGIDLLVVPGCAGDEDALLALAALGADKLAMVFTDTPLEHTHLDDLAGWLDIMESRGLFEQPDIGQHLSLVANPVNVRSPRGVPPERYAPLYVPGSFSLVGNLLAQDRLTSMAQPAAGPEQSRIPGQGLRIEIKDREALARVESRAICAVRGTGGHLQHWGVATLAIHGDMNEYQLTRVRGRVTREVLAMFNRAAFKRLNLQLIGQIREAVQAYFSQISRGNDRLVDQAICHSVFVSPDNRNRLEIHATLQIARAVRQFLLVAEVDAGGAQLVTDTLSAT